MEERELSELLSYTQRRVLEAILALFQEKNKSITSEEVSMRLGDLKPTTVRGAVRKLKQLGLIESKPGPRGGYKPTAKAYELLGLAVPGTARLRLVEKGKELSALSMEIHYYPEYIKIVAKCLSVPRYVRPIEPVEIELLPECKIVGELSSVNLETSEVVVVAKRSTKS